MGGFEFLAIEIINYSELNLKTLLPRTKAFSFVELLQKYIVVLIQPFHI